MQNDAVAAEVGLILMDLSLNVVAFDRGAAAILGPLNQADGETVALTQIPKDILDSIRTRKPMGSSPLKMYFRLGRGEYSCRTYLVDFPSGPFRQAIVALQLEKLSSINDAIYQAGAKYHLTEREQEALRGILMGLTAKEVANQMNISPNTVKAFLRLIMIKMGVATRAAIVAKILQNQSSSSPDRPMAPQSPHLANAAAASINRGHLNPRTRI